MKVNSKVAYKVIEAITFLSDIKNTLPLVHEIYPKISKGEQEKLAQKFADGFTETAGKIAEAFAKKAGLKAGWIFFDDPEVAILITALQKNGVTVEAFSSGLNLAIAPCDDGRFWLQLDDIGVAAKEYTPQKPRSK